MPNKILIIEDDKFLRELMARKLHEENYLVFEEAEGENGVKAIKEQKPDLVLLDLILPGVDGFEILGQIKQDSETKNVPVIILSNLGQKEDIDRGFKLGAVDYLIKAHFTPGEIVEKIKKILK